MTATPEWISALAPSSQTDKYLRMGVLLAFLIWNWTIATHLETPYPATLVEAYSIPLTRIAILLLVVLSAMWCPTVGILVALAYLSLGADTLFFTSR
jgi:hypothetical protein